MITNITKYNVISNIFDLKYHIKYDRKQKFLKRNMGVNFIKKTLELQLSKEVKDILA